MMRKRSAQKMLNEYCTVLKEYLDCKSNVNGYKPLNVNDASRKCE